MKNSMELRVLSYFLAVAREENFTRAASRLHITQPTLSRQIAQLEDELGVRLFVRGNRNAVLTEDGMILRRRAQELLELAEKTKSDFVRGDEMLEGTVSVGSGEFLSTRVLSDCIAAFSKKHPLVKYKLHSGNAADIKERIGRGLLDAGLTNLPVDIGKYEFVTMPVNEEWGVFAPFNSDIAEKGYVTPSDFIGIPVVSSVNERVKENIEKWLGEYADGTEFTAHGNLLYNEVMLASSLGGISVGIKLDCTYDGLRFVPFSPPLTSSTALIWKKDQVFSSAASAFIEFTKQYLKGIASDKM